MAHGVSEALGEGNTVKMVHQKQQQQSATVHQQSNARKSVGVMGSRRIFAPAFKLKVLDSYRNDIDCRGNQRATARKYGIHRRQIQKWLQCEENLRNSCAENGSAIVHGAGVPAVAGKRDCAVAATEAAGPAVAPAAPALNLSLARLHGDELAAQQGPPLLPRPRGDSPSSPEYAAPSVLPVRLGYREYPPTQEQRFHRRGPEDRVQATDTVRGCPEARLGQEQPAYYVPKLEEPPEPESSETSGSFDAKCEAKVYQTLTSYRAAARQERRYDGETIDGPRRGGSPSRHRSPRSREDADSTDGRSHGSLPAASTIKSERASPDSAATPGPCGPVGEPRVPRLPLSPVPHPGNRSASVHLASPRPSASPSCLHVHAHGSPATDSEKPSQPSDSTGKGTGSAAEEAEIGRAVVKEELHIDEEEDEDGSEEGREATATVSYNGIGHYRRPPADSRPASPAGHDPEGYSLPSSPRGPTSPGRSSSSCSDSEMDPLDCSSGSQNSSNDLARRRSFSLRFKLDVLDAFHRDVGVAGNQRATARKFGINRRQVQKWLGQETELRGEIAVRGNSRQRLGPVQDAASGESPVDLSTSSHASSLSRDRIEEHERSPPPLYCCDVGSSSSQHLYYRQPATDSFESEPISCTLSCCTAGPATCYQDASIRGSCYPDTQARLYCYSPREYTEIGSVAEPSDELSSKRQRCDLPCCYEPLSPPKRLCLEPEEPLGTGSSCQDTPPQDTPPQDTPLCLVKPKRLLEAFGSEPVTSTVPTPPASAPPPQGPTSRDGILFKPYLDNPVSKPSKEPPGQRLSPVSSQYVVVNNNNNCQSICNLNEPRSHDYALELSLRLPVSWRTHPAAYTEFPQIGSAFVRYPASPHYS